MGQIILQHREHQYRIKAQQDLQKDYVLPCGDHSSEEWRKHLLNAKISWEKLTEQEIIKSAGSVKKLAGLIRQRYALSHLDAEKQVNAFLKKHSVQSRAVQTLEQKYE